ncbi:MAG: DUF1588 domain-containing protein [Myxococcota bacterium]
MSWLGCEPELIDVSPVSGLGRTDVAPTLPKPQALPAFQAPEFNPEAPVFVRLTAPQYRLAIGDLFGEGITPPVRLEPDVQSDGLYAIGAAESTLSPKGAEQYVNGAKAMALQMTEEGYRDTLYSPCEPTSASDLTCLKTLAHHWGSQLWRRPLTDDEAGAMATLASQSAAALEDLDSGVRWMMVALLNAPQFLYRVELGQRDAEGRLTLTDYERVTRLAMFLWNSVPDAAVLERVQAGEFTDAPAFEALVDEMLKDPRARRGLRNFITEWLHLGDLGRLLKDPNVFRAYNPDLGAAALEETLSVAEWLVFEERADFRTILTTQTTFVDRRLAAIYELIAPTEEGMGKLTLPDDEVRRGILGHVSFLAARAHVAKSSPTLRGVFVREVLLCQEMSPPPADVDTSIPEPSEDALTLRDRLEVHMEDPACSGCHAFVDPIGFGLERFDGIGRFRTLDNGGLIDPSGDLDGSEFDGFVELVSTLANHPGFIDCVVEKLLAYAINRRPGYDERPWREALVESFRQDGHDLLNLMRRIALSPGFSAIAEPDIEEVTP